MIIVLDGSESLTADDLTLLRGIDEKKAMIVVNKNDLPLGLDSDELKNLDALRTVTSVSARTGSGIEGLKEKLRSLILDCQAEETPIVLSNLRHKAALARAERSLRDAEVTLAKNCPPELAAVELGEAREALEEIIGMVTPDELLELVFKNFCIGK